MLDFLMIATRSGKRGVIEIYPKFMVKRTNDLMIRGGDFYAIWVEERGLWSTDEQDAVDLIDRELDRYAEENHKRFDDNIRVLHMWDAETGMIGQWHKYCQKDMRDSFHMLDEKLIFANTKTGKRDYASKSLSYPLEAGETPAWDKLVGTLYSPVERHKIEWCIGSIVTGDSKRLQKFMVFYGAVGTGKSTIINVIQQLFDGYYTSFNAKDLGSSSNAFALEAFRSNPLVAIQHDGDLSRIEDNTRINSLVSHEMMVVNEKFRSAYSNRFKAFLIMGTNKPVKITDAKSGIIRRLIDVSPTGDKVPPSEYRTLTKQIPFELGGIAYLTLGATEQVSLTSVNNQINAAILQKIEALPKAHNILKEAKDNATQIMNMATTGYITITKDAYGSDTLYISNTRDYTKANKLWKWNMNGLGYSSDGGKTYGLAITMDGSIVADYITTGVLNANVIRAGELKDYGGNFSLDFGTGKLTMKKGSINIGGNFIVDEDENVTATRGTFAGTLVAAKGTFGGQLTAATGSFKGVVQAEDFLDKYGNSMLDLAKQKFTAEYLDLYGITITNRSTRAVTFKVDGTTGEVTINGKVTMGAGSSINWAQVSNQNLTSNPAYALANSAYNYADAAYDYADDAAYDASLAWARATTAYNNMCTDQNVFNILTSGGTKFGIFSDSTYGRLYINANYIKTGTIDASIISLSGNYGGFCQARGFDGVQTTYGAMMYGSGSPYFIVTNRGCRMEGTGANFYVCNGIVASEEISVGSDLRIKNTISYNLDRYDAFFMALKPTRFKYNHGVSGRLHLGFIAQDVEQAMLDAGLTSDDLAALIKAPVQEVMDDGIEDFHYSLRYGEFIALNTHMIQKLYRMCFCCVVAPHFNNRQKAALANDQNKILFTRLKPPLKAP